MNEFKGTLYMNDKQAQTYGPMLYDLSEKHKGLTPELLLKEARKKRSPLHSWFEWDDTEAAEHYRLIQARRMIRSVEVVANTHDINVRALQQVRYGDDEVKFQTIQTIASDEELRSQVIEKARREYEAWRKRWIIYQELEPLFAATEEALLKL